MSHGEKLSEDDKDLMRVMLVSLVHRFEEALRNDQPIHITQSKGVERHEDGTSCADGSYTITLKLGKTS